MQLSISSTQTSQAIVEDIIIAARFPTWMITTRAVSKQAIGIAVVVCPDSQNIISNYNSKSLYKIQEIHHNNNHYSFYCLLLIRLTVKHMADNHNSCMEIFMTFAGGPKQWICCSDCLHSNPDMILKSVL